MPIYEYECQACGTVMEVTQSIKDDKLSECDCSKCKDVMPVKRIVSASTFHLKGRRWAKDGYSSALDEGINLI